MIGHLKISVLIIFSIILLSKTTYGKPLRNNKRSNYGVNAIGARSSEAPEESSQTEYDQLPEEDQSQSVI